MPEPLPAVDLPLDIEALRQEAIDSDECVGVTRRWLRRALLEIEAGRAAMAQQGMTFSGRRL